MDRRQHTRTEIQNTFYLIYLPPPASNPQSSLILHPPFNNLFPTLQPRTPINQTRSFKASRHGSRIRSVLPNIDELVPACAGKKPLNKHAHVHTHSKLRVVVVPRE
ncbi:hypothetical protein MA16_Dca010229 [Dendrobium catenatum]|uniref:Uncharacterized protein n=1 Tax=Dendrobium catenatum TaxID=906689 RepID=A0A2I0WAH4_9ASPA|nr:hypothetical protein MA16_Dca010229 [Dendrobium catenatum]